MLTAPDKKELRRKADQTSGSYLASQYPSPHVQIRQREVIYLCEQEDKYKLLSVQMHHPSCQHSQPNKMIL
jgi:hypothetical protein